MKTEDIKEVTIRITDPGDPSVGIFEQTVNINDPVFLDEDDREAFRDFLRYAFEYVMDTPYIVFSDEEQSDDPLDHEGITLEKE